MLITITTTKPPKVFVGSGQDQILIDLSHLPSPHPHLGVGCATINAAQGTGAEWVRKHLGVEPEIVDMTIHV